MTMKLYYFPIRGRAEVFRILLSYVKADWEELTVDYAFMKNTPDEYYFGQCPRIVDGDLNILQSNTILRYLARKFNLEGTNEQEKITADMALEAVESLRLKYVVLIYQDQLSDAGKESFVKTHISKEGLAGRNGGAHVDYFEGFLRRSGTGFVAGNALTVGDLAVWEMTDLLLRIFPEEIKSGYPLLMEHYNKVAEMEGIKQYLSSPRRFDKPNGNTLG